MKRASDKVASNSNDLPGDGGDDDDTLKKRDLPPPGWKRSRLLLVMRGVDEVISSHLFLAATESSPLAKYRRMLSMFEKSAHFAIWFGGLVFLMWFFSIDVAIRTFLFNVFLGCPFRLRLPQLGLESRPGKRCTTAYRRPQTATASARAGSLRCSARTCSTNSGPSSEPRKLRRANNPWLKPRRGPGPPHQIAERKTSQSADAYHCARCTLSFQISYLVVQRI
nr:uncharacterized protein LOC126547719 isoform X3 [Dermacentor andersoni]